MTRRFPTFIAATLLATLSAIAAIAAPAGARTAIAAARSFAPRQVVVEFAGAQSGQTVALPPQVGVQRAAAALRRSPRVAYAEPNYIATASQAGAESPFYDPNDRGTITNGGIPGGWASKQWNFLPWASTGKTLLPTSPGGIDAPAAWQNLIAAGRPGAEGETVAVLDTGIAYRSMGRNFRRSPDFSAGQFVKGYDFVANDPFPLDQNGHGTHVAGTIAEKTDNGIGLTGLAYRAKLMPVRVLDRQGEGTASNIAKGIDFAVAHGANVINMSFNFACHQKVPEVDAALKQAYEKGVVAVASVGNLRSEACVSPPATAPHVIGVGGTTEGGCLGSYSLAGKGVDVVAPGGGEPKPGCPSVLDQPIFQVTFAGRNTKVFGIPGSYFGTSMAAAHVSATAAMILAAGVIPKTTPQGLVQAVTQRLEETARSIGLPANQQGAGLIDAGKATAPTISQGAPQGSKGARSH
jgi:serine protease